MELIKKERLFLRIFIWFLTGFLTGFLTFSLKTEFENRIDPSSGVISLTDKQIENISSDLDLRKFWYVYALIKDKYIDNEGLLKTDLIDSAISGLVKGVGDKHSEYLYGDELKAFDESLNGSFEGIGAFVSKVDGGIRIDSIIKGSPAKKAGVLAGDVIIEANEIELAPLEKYDAISKIKGPAGTKVTLKIFRESEGIIEKEVIRGKINIPTVTSEIFDGNIGYISINTFGDGTTDSFNYELNKMNKKDVNGLIIDLRDNGGGYLTSAVFILSNFIEKNMPVTIVKSTESSIGAEEYVSLNDGTTFDKNIVVLINENSASASEITAGVLSYYKKALLVGNKSYGKGSVQRTFPVGEDAILKITTSKWYIPDMTNVDGKGLTPDIISDLDIERLKEGEDSQLENAKEIIKMLNISPKEDVINHFSN